MQALASLAARPPGRQLLIPGEGFYASPPPPFAPHVGSAFTVLSGGCTTSYECVYSPNYPSDYDCGIYCDGECTILPNTQQPLDVRDFDVEWNWDFLMINNMGYTGQLDNPGHAATIPDGVVPLGGSTDVAGGQLQGEWSAVDAARRELQRPRRDGWRSAPRVYDDRVHGRVLSECVSSSVS